jgi:hypothetical protein
MNMTLGSKILATIIIGTLLTLGLIAAYGLFQTGNIQLAYAANFFFVIAGSILIWLIY